jgi:hypothetical protein
MTQSSIPPTGKHRDAVAAMAGWLRCLHRCRGASPHGRDSGTRLRIDRTWACGRLVREGRAVGRLMWRARRSVAFALTTSVCAVVTVATIVPASEVAVHAASCDVFDHGNRVARDPCPSNAPTPVCTTFAGDGECSRWLLFHANGATQMARECDIDEYFGSALTRLPANPADAGPFCFGKPPPGAAPGEITPVLTGLPQTATSVLANLTMVDGSGWGYITADRCSALAAGPQTKSNGNHGQYGANANLAVVPVDADARFCLYNSHRVQLVVDIQGYFAPPAAGGLLFVPATPRRLVDTRLPPLTMPSAGSITRVQTGVAPGTTSALVNITMVDGVQPGYITADRCSALASGPQIRSNGNVPTATAIANLSVVNVDADGSFCVFTNVGTNIIVDLQGSFAESPSPAASGLGFQFVAPTRVFDSRTISTSLIRPGTITKVNTGVAAGTASVLVNLTMVDTPWPGYITADKCSVMTARPQDKSNGNHPSGTPTSNLSVVPVDADGSFCIYNSSWLDLVVDLQGSFAPSASQRFFAVTPSRVLDTRNE